MAYLNIDKKIAENVNSDNLIKILNGIIDAETQKPLETMNCDLIDSCVDALLEIEKEKNHIAVMVPLMLDEKFLKIIKSKNSTWSSLSAVAKTAIIVAAVMGSTITVNAMIDSVFDYNILKEIGKAITSLGAPGEPEGPEIVVGEDDDGPITTEPTSETTTAVTTEKETTAAASEVTTTQPLTTEKTETTTEKETTTSPKPETTTKKVSANDVYHKTTKPNSETVTAAPKVVGLSASLSDSFCLHYIYGEKLSYNGLTLTAQMSDGTEKAVSLSDCQYTDNVNMQKTADVTLNIIYKGFLVEIPITVRPTEETRISEIKSNSRYEYLKCSSGAYVTAYKGNDSELRCDYADGLKIFAISHSVFSKNKELRSVELPFVTELGNSVFENCPSLVSVYAPNIKTIGNNAFNNCSALRTVELGNDLSSVGEKAFAKTSLEELTLGENVTEIPASMCESCPLLEEVTLLGNVTSVGDWAFAECESLLTVTGTENIKYAGDYAFSNCLEVQFEFPENLEYAGENAFYFCRQLEIGDIPRTLTYIGPWAFAYCPGVTKITVPEGISVISANAFRATNATEVVIPNGVKRLEDGAFESCKFTKVKIPESVEYIGEHALYNVLLQSVDFDCTKTEIDSKAFYLSRRLEFRCYSDSDAYAFAIANGIKTDVKERFPEVVVGEDD